MSLLDYMELTKFVFNSRLPFLIGAERKGEKVGGLIYLKPLRSRVSGLLIR
jgi:hypothetical protein